MNPEDLIVPALRRETVAWPAGARPDLQGALLTAAADHGVNALLATAPGISSWPEPVREALRAAVRIEAAVEAVRHRQIEALLEGFRTADIPVLLLKGAQLAYTHYPHPWLRPCVDVDVLVAAADRTRADRTLRALGYRPGTHFDGSLVTHQYQYQRDGPHGLTDLVDLHWRISNPHVFAGALDVEELQQRAVPIPALGPHVRGLSDAHALLLACLHRVAHHAGSDRLIWLYDIHLIARGMDDAGRTETADLAIARRLAAVCADGMIQAVRRFGTGVPGDWLARLQPPGGSTEPSAEFLEHGRTKIDILRSDLQTLPGWRPRLRLIREHLFPPAAYIRRTYGIRNPLLVPLAYAHRMASGVRNWFRRG